MPTQAQAQAQAQELPAIPCIARQPILTQEENVVGYELLCHQNLEEERLAPDAESAGSVTIDTLSVIGLEVLCDGQLAFIGCTQQMLLQDSFALLPPAEVVVEIQEIVSGDESVVAAWWPRAGGSNAAGYAIALDNFVPDDKRETLVPYANCIRVDIKKIGSDKSSDLVKRYASKQRQMLAQRVESRHDYIVAMKSGFTLFQGYFFRHPEKLRARRFPADQASCLRLLQAISRPDANFTEIEDLIKRDPALRFRLLRYLNSPLLGLSTPVESVRHALNLLGERELARWIRTVSTLVMAQDKPSDLILSSLVRARFCELLAPKLKHGESDLFFLGILSLMDAILEVPIGVIVENLSLNSETREQLLCGKTGGKTPLSPVYDLMLVREAGDWEAVNKLGKQLDLSLVFINKAYNEAMRWAREVTRPGEPGPSS